MGTIPEVAPGSTIRSDRRESLKSRVMQNVAFLSFPAHGQPGAAPLNEPRTGPFRTKRIGPHRGSTRSPNDPSLLLVPTVLRGNAVLAAPRPLCRPDPTTRSVEDAVPTEDRGNECEIFQILILSVFHPCSIRGWIPPS